MKKNAGYAAVVIAVVAGITAATVAATAGVSRAATTYPASMAAAGDSITRAYDIAWWGALRDNPAYSWSTGTNTTVNSEYSRLLKLSPALSGHAYNDAKTGAKRAALDGQLKTAAGQHVAYVTVLMGANDICTSSIATMTPTSTVQSEFRQAMRDLTDPTSGDPAVKVFVSSIPNIYQLWSTLHTNSAAAWAWRTYGVCQSMLAASNTDAQRQQVLAREQADNQAIAAVCTTEFAQWCRWDNDATYNVKFTAGDVSTVDYFHPSVTGQAKLAATSWAASYWAP